MALNRGALADAAAEAELRFWLVRDDELFTVASRKLRLTLAVCITS
jgi:hypothetical protein